MNAGESSAESGTERLRGDLRTLARRLSHDLRTPLNSVSTASEALGRLPATESSQAALAQTMLGAVKEISILIERVSFVLQATADPAPPQPVAMRDAVWSALQRLETRTRRHGATIVQPDSWPEVSGVRSWLEVIWENLIGNSLAHGGPDPRIELAWERAADAHRFRVRDHGAGVAPARRARLFTPFDRLHELNAPRGIGLPITLRLVEQQGGRCEYESPADGGACFVFTLPLAPAPV